MVMSLVGGVTMKGTMLWGFGQLANPVLLAIPLFILAGTLMSVSGIAASLLQLVNVFIGHVRGGLGVVATVQLRHHRRHLGQRPDRCGRHRAAADPGNGQAGLSARLCVGTGGLLVGARPAHSAERDDDRLRLGHRHVDPGLRSWPRSGPA